MVDLLKAGAGTFTYLIGCFIMLLTLHIVPPLANYLQNETTISGASTLAGIIWFGLILIWILGTLVIPIGLMVWGITIPSEIKNPVFLMSIGILWFIISSAFSYFSYYMTSSISEMMSATIGGVEYILPVVLFWIGLVAIWIFNIGVIPTYFIIESRS